MKKTKKKIAFGVVSALSIVTPIAIVLPLKSKDNNIKIAQNFSALNELNSVDNNIHPASPNIYPSLEQREIWRKQENSLLRQSDLHPLGYFVHKNDVIKLKLNNSSSRRIAVALPGKFDNFNAKKDMKDEDVAYFDNFDENNEITFTAPIDGLVYVSTPLSEKLTEEYKNLESFIYIRGQISSVPTFSIGDNFKDFYNQIMLADENKTPFVEMISEKVVFTIQMKLIKEFFATKTYEELTSREFNYDLFLRQADYIYNQEAELYGLSRDFDGVAHKNNTNIHVVTSDWADGGAYAYAENGAVFFQKNLVLQDGSIKLGGGSAKELLSEMPLNNWGFMHETGHVWQNSLFTFVENREVLVNLSPLHIQTNTPNYNDKTFYNRIMSSSDIQASMDWYFNKNLPDRDIDAEIPDTAETRAYLYKGKHENIREVNSTFYQAAMYYQLETAFGSNFYKIANQICRNLPPQITSYASALSKQDKKDIFAKIASEASGYNLLPFFDQWGYKISNEARVEIQNSHYKDLTKPIWLNMYDNNMHLQDYLENYKPTSVSNLIAPFTSQIKQLNLSEDLNTHNIGQYFNLGAEKDAVDKSVISIEKDFANIDANNKTIPLIIKVKNKDEVVNSFKVIAGYTLNANEKIITFDNFDGKQAVSLFINDKGFVLNTNSYLNSRGNESLFWLGLPAKVLTIKITMTDGTTKDIVFNGDESALNFILENKLNYFSKNVKNVSFEINSFDIYEPNSHVHNGSYIRVYDQNTITPEEKTGQYIVNANFQ